MTITESTGRRSASSEAVQAERWKIRTDIAATSRIFGAKGFEYGGAGHLTARDPERDDLFWVNPAGLPFSLTTASDILLVRRDGEVVEGERTAQGYQSQFEIHDARPELRAAVHTHSPYGFAWSSRGGLLDALTTDSAGLRGLQAFRNGFDVPVTEALGDTARLLIQKHHGFIGTGATIAEAAWYFVNAERAAKTQLLLLAAGRADAVPEELAEKWVYSPELAHRAFDLSIRELLAHEPDIES